MNEADNSTPRPTNQAPGSVGQFLVKTIDQDQAILDTSTHSQAALIRSS